ncbi:Protein FAR1-RELATED SEQUENCE 5 [Ananas comosus]|uniref:Protein FAR1-RELATED SEQUENCE n=1 Tax=Ananas comosus TaxID=4615 RepID=A0A199V5B8_ANACO|nr:Protein FAR1-RELATED SEQUENCE 5 [Ananas comosus]
MRGGEVKLYSYDPIEVQARTIEIDLGHSLLELEKNSLYKITAIHNPTMTYIVSVNRLTEKVSCNCKMFEFTGLLCSHILKVLHYIGIYSIPSHYILKRWTKNAQRRSFNIQSIQHEAMGDSVHAKAIRSNALSQQVQEIVHQGAKSFGSFELTCQLIKRVVDEIVSHNQASNEVQDKEVEEFNVVPLTQTSDLDVIVKDPPQSQCKGKRKPQRFKPSAEKRAKKSRTCAKCKKKGHNVRTCKEVAPGDAYFDVDTTVSILKLVGFSMKALSSAALTLQVVIKHTMGANVISSRLSDGLATTVGARHEGLPPSSPSAYSTSFYRAPATPPQGASCTSPRAHNTAPK